METLKLNRTFVIKLNNAYLNNTHKIITEQKRNSHTTNSQCISKGKHTKYNTKCILQ